MDYFPDKSKLDILNDPDTNTISIIASIRVGIEERIQELKDKYRKNKSLSESEFI
jgi:hypothetical protein